MLALMGLGIGGGFGPFRVGVSTRGAGVGVGPFSAGGSWKGKKKRKSGAKKAEPVGIPLSQRKREAANLVAKQEGEQALEVGWHREPTGNTGQERARYWDGRTWVIGSDMWWHNGNGPEPGWYRGEGTWERYWDGGRWTGYVRRFRSNRRSKIKPKVAEPPMPARLTGYYDLGEGFRRFWNGDAWTNSGVRRTWYKPTGGPHAGAAGWWRDESVSNHPMTIDEPPLPDGSLYSNAARASGFEGLGV